MASVSSPRGILRTTSLKWRPGTAALPGFATAQGTVTAVVTSRSVPVTVRVPLSASSSRQESNGIGLLVGTEAMALATAYARSPCWIVSSIWYSPKLGSRSPAMGSWRRRRVEYGGLKPLRERWLHDRQRPVKLQAFLVRFSSL